MALDFLEKSYLARVPVNLAITLTLSRIVLVPLLMVFLISSSRVDTFIAAAIFLLAALTDWLDGMVARRRNQVTAMGKLLDPVADKILISAAFISLVQIGQVPAWMVVLIIGREFAVTGLRGIIAASGLVVAASEIAKYKTAVQCLAILLLILDRGVPDELKPAYTFFAQGALWAALVLTLISGVDYFLRFLKGSDLAVVKRPQDRWP